MTFDEQCESLCGKFGLSREDLGLLALRWISTMEPDDDMNSFLWWLRNSTQEQVDTVVCPDRKVLEDDAICAKLVEVITAEPGLATLELSVRTDNGNLDATECRLDDLWEEGLVHKIERQCWMPGPGDDDGP